MIEVLINSLWYIGKLTLMFHWYCKTAYNLGQFFFQIDL